MKNLIKKSVLKSKVLPIIDGTFLVSDNNIVITDLEQKIVIKNQNLGFEDGVYNTLFQKVFDKSEYPTNLEFISVEAGIEFKADYLISTIKNMIKFTSNDEIRPTMMSVLFDFENIAIVSTDGHRLKSCNLQYSGTTEVKNVMMPKIFKITIFESLCKYFGPTKIKMQVDKKYICFSCKDFEYYIRIVDGMFPNYKAIVPLSQTWVKTITISQDILKQMGEDQKDYKKVTKNAFYKLQIDAVNQKAVVIDVDYDYQKEYKIEVKDVRKQPKITTDNVNLVMPMLNNNDDNFIVIIDYFAIKDFESNQTWYFYDDKRCLISIPESTKMMSVKNLKETVKIDEVKKVKQEVMVEKLITSKDIKADNKILIQIVPYSDKSFAVIGKGTFKIKDELLKFGKYNRGLRCGAGYIFSNKTKEKVLQLLTTNELL